MDDMVVFQIGVGIYWILVWCGHGMELEFL